MLSINKIDKSKILSILNDNLFEILFNKFKRSKYLSCGKIDKIIKQENSSLNKLLKFFNFKILNNSSKDLSLETFIKDCFAD